MPCPAVAVHRHPSHTRQARMGEGLSAPEHRPRERQSLDWRFLSRLGAAVRLASHRAKRRPPPNRAPHQAAPLYHDNYTLTIHLARANVGSRAALQEQRKDEKSTARDSTHQDERKHSYPVENKETHTRSLNTLSTAGTPAFFYPRLAFSASSSARVRASARQPKPVRAMPPHPASPGRTAPTT